MKDLSIKRLSENEYVLLDGDKRIASGATMDVLVQDAYRVGMVDAIEHVKKSDQNVTAQASIGEMLKSMSDDVGAFMKKLEHPLPQYPERLSDRRKEFRHDFLHEELEEFGVAETFSDEVDALLDIIYVALGALLEMGAYPTAHWHPIQVANMAKIKGEVSTRPGSAGHDAIKPEGWTPPDHLAVFEDLKLRSKVPPAMLEATKVLLERSAAYNAGTVKREDHFPFGITSVFQMMWVKVIRMRSDIENGVDVKRDHLIDLINYANFGVNLLDGRPM